jgi:hypothetical protein
MSSFPGSRQCGEELSASVHIVSTSPLLSSGGNIWQIYKSSMKYVLPCPYLRPCPSPGPCPVFMSLPGVHVYTQCPCPCPVSMSMHGVHVNAQCPRSCPHPCHGLCLYPCLSLCRCPCPCPLSMFSFSVHVYLHGHGEVMYVSK